MEFTFSHAMNKIACMFKKYVHRRRVLAVTDGPEKECDAQLNIHT